jgi:hypothetical protein
MDSIVQKILYSLSSNEAEVDALSSGLGDVLTVALSVLSEVIASPTDSLTQLAEASYIHANGFEKLVCGATAPESPKIRIHVWPATATTLQHTIMVGHSIHTYSKVPSLQQSMK